MATIDASRSSQADQDRGSSFAAELERDRAHRAKARSLKPLQRLMPFVFAYPGLLIAFGISLALAAGLTLVFPAAFRLVIDCGFSTDPAPSYCAGISPDGDWAIFFVAGMVVAVLLGVVSALRFYFVTRLGERVVADLRRAVFDHLLGLDAAFYSNIQTGEVLSRLTTDTTLIQTVVGSSFSIAIRTVVTTLGALILMIVVNWQLALLVLVMGPLILGPIQLFARRIQRLSRSSQDELAGVSARAGESLQAIETVQAFTREPEERAAFADAVERTYSVAMRRTRVRAMMTALIFSVVLAGLIAVFWFGAGQVRSGAISPGAMAQFVLYAFIAVSGVGMLTETYSEVLRAAGATERLMELLSGRALVEDPQEPIDAADRPAGEITFEGVAFRYPNRPEVGVLDQFDLTVDAGSTVALVGPSGAGKSTVLKLLLRLYDPGAGQIRLDGVDIRTRKLDQLRDSFAIVEQNAPLFSGSVRDNIGFGRPSASAEEIEAAARAANAHDFITALPDGYDTPLGERGASLSGGQRQRIAIARAVLRDAPILLLDEATSALDSESERLIQAAVAELAKTRTTLVIAHRLATVRRADKIAVVDQGRVVEQGAHDELMAQDGLYARYIQLQSDTDPFFDVGPED